MVRRHPWLVPDWADAEGNIAMRTQAFVVELDGARCSSIRASATARCAGCRSEHLDLPFLERLAAVGVAPRRRGARWCTPTCTPTMSDGTRTSTATWVPTFTSAASSYTELEHVRRALPGEASPANGNG